MSIILKEHKISNGNTIYKTIRLEQIGETYKTRALESEEYDREFDNFEDAVRDYYFKIKRALQDELLQRFLKGKTMCKKEFNSWEHLVKFVLVDCFECGIDKACKKRVLSGTWMFVE